MIADWLNLTSLLKKSFFPGWSKMPGCKAPEILRVASRRIRSDLLPRRRVGESARGVPECTSQRRRMRGGVATNKERLLATPPRWWGGRITPQTGVFQQPVAPWYCSKNILRQGPNLRRWLLFPPDYLLGEIILFSYAIMCKKISFTRIFSDWQIQHNLIPKYSSIQKDQLLLNKKERGERM